MQLLMLAMTFMMSLGTWAQGQHGGKFDPEEFRARLEGFISHEAGFTEQEAQKFFPIYHEMKGKQMKLQQEMFKLKKNCPDKKLTDKECLNAIQKIKNMNVEIAQIEENYYKKMCKAIGPRKVYLAMLAEDDFHRKMLGWFNKGKNGREDRKNHKK